MIEKIYEELNIHQALIPFEQTVEEAIEEQLKAIDTIVHYNQLKVLKAFQAARVSEDDFNTKTGYGFNDVGREKLERIYADVFHTEDALVRPIIVSGTHALSLCLTGLLMPGDELLAITGKPYDTLEEVIGINKNNKRSLINLGVHYQQVDLTDDGFDEELILKKLTADTTMVYIQRSSGYSWRESLTIKAIEKIITKIKQVNPNVIVMVDNCYGEFLEEKEPTDVGADLMAGSLIKNPGGGLAIAGGYIVGKKDLITLVADRLTAPGIGKEQGLMFNQTRSMMQGFFTAPKVVGDAVKGAIFCAQAYQTLGYRINPAVDGSRSDIIQAIQFNSKEELIAFCRAIQGAAPIDSFVQLEPWAMPGYNHQVIMAAGAFVQGSSIELSADAPIKEPYIGYFQGGLSYEHAKFGVLKSISKLKEMGFLTIKER
jgi:cystathionine beta-lyase family protein involved in aluminum resistance